MDKDYFKQNQGPHQGNIHEQSDKGENEGEHAGTTLDKTENSDQVFWNHTEHLTGKEKDENNSLDEEKESTNDTQ